MARRPLAHRGGESDRRRPPGLGHRFFGQRIVTLDMLKRETEIAVVPSASFRSSNVDRLHCASLTMRRDPDSR